MRGLTNLFFLVPPFVVTYLVWFRPNAKARKSVARDRASVASPTIPTEIPCGMSVGMMRASYPLARISITPNSIEVSGLGRTYFSTRADIAAVRRIRVIFQTGYKIIGHNGKTVTVWPTGGLVEQELARNGWVVSGR